MGQMKRPIVLLVMIASISSIGLASNQAYAGFDVDLGDYKCYDAFFDLSQEPAILEDQFGIMNILVEDIIKVCPPVFKSGEPPGNGFPGFPSSPSVGFPDNHFVVHEICDSGYPPPGCGALPPLGQSLKLTDHFGTTIHQVMEPIELWVPAVKQDRAGSFFPSNSNDETEIHYKCYNIEPVDNPLGFLEIDLLDQFADRNNDILKADKLCTPVKKTVITKGEQTFGTLDTEHLKCYTILDDPLFDLDDSSFTFSEQFFQGNLLIETEHEVCLVADKEVLKMIGGSLIPIDSTSFLLAGAQMTASWMIPVVVAGIGIGFVVLRKVKNPNF